MQDEQLLKEMLDYEKGNDNEPRQYLLRISVIWAKREKHELLLSQMLSKFEDVELKQSTVPI